ncbi:MAG: penicillin-binding protein 2 [Nitrospina sp.]|jgi:cell division protein FtsI (penicillin-binding protein 3)|nr:penicillin-binding protein 2 [Nitrospina sp.]MBT5631733.1 penicillin-binding protein 2 [Nitrospina sp.]
MAKQNKQTAGTFRDGIKVRIKIVSVLLFLFVGALIARLAFLQIIQHDTLVAKSEKQYLSTVKTHFGRGIIYDRSLNELARNVEVESVYVNPSEILDRKTTARILSAALKLDPDQVRKKISSKKHFVWIKRKCPLHEVAELKKSDLSGVGYVSEQKRFYPKRELAANVLGFVGMDNQGLAGIEHAYQSKLKGTTFRQVMERDARGRNIQSVEGLRNSNPRNYDLALTLDEVIQFTTEYHLKKQVEHFKADSGMAVVMNPHTGEIYAMANVPQFNPNRYGAFPQQSWKNNIIASSYEPGSIFKPIVAAAALDKGLARPQDIFFCENGKMKIGNVHIGEASDHKFGWLTMQDIIAKSSNIGAIKIAQQVGKEPFYEYIRKFGFGEKSGLSLPGESAGQLKKQKDWNQLSLASISFGHEIAVTPIQMVSAMAAIANGGNLMQPHITHALIKGERVVKQFKPEKIRRVISEKTSRQLIEVLKSVVKTGTGKKAALEGFDVAGKTGTAQKYNSETQSYSKTEFISSFIGFAPADSPRLVILVMIDNPKGLHWGSVVAAPVFREIAKKALRYLNVPSSKERVFILDRA